MPESKTGAEYYGPEEMDRLELERLSPGGPRDVGPGMSLRMSYPEALGQVAKDKVEEFMNELRGTVMLPGDVYKGDVDIKSAGGIDQAVRMGMNIGQSGLISGAAVPDKGTLGMFIGPKAKNFDTAKAESFKQSAEGVPFFDWDTRAPLWGETGTMQSPSGHLWQEISDSLSKLKVPFNKPFQAKLGDVLDHPDLFNSYPDLANVKVRNLGGIDPDKIGANALADLKKDEIVMNIAPNHEEDFRSVLLHEIQHMIQHRDGIPNQGSPKDAYQNAIQATGMMETSSIRENWEQLQNYKKDPHFGLRLYQNYENEQLAEMTQSRMHENLPERLDFENMPSWGHVLPAVPRRSFAGKEAIQDAIDYANRIRNENSGYSKGGEVVNRGGIESLLQHSRKTGKPIRKFGYGGEVDGGGNEYAGAVGSASDQSYGGNTSYGEAMGPVGSGGFSFDGISGSSNGAAGMGVDGGSIGLGDTSGGSFGTSGGDGVIGGSDPIGGGSWSGSYGEGSSGVGSMTGTEALGVASQGMTTSGEVFGGTDGHEFVGTSPISDTLTSNVDRALGPVGPAGFGTNNLTGAVPSSMAPTMENPLGTINPTANPIGIPDLIDPNTFGYQQMDYAKSAVNTPSVSITDRDIRDLAAINGAEAGIIAQNFINQGYPPDVARQMAFAHVTDTVVNRSVLTGQPIRDVIDASRQFSPVNKAGSVSNLPASPDDIAATRSYLGTMSTWGPQNPQATSFANRTASTDRSWLDTGTKLGTVGVPGTPSHEVSTGVPGRYGGVVPDYNLNLPASTPRIDSPVEMATRQNPNMNVAGIPSPTDRPYETFDTNRTYAGRELEQPAQTQTASNDFQQSAPAPEITANGERLGAGLPGLAYTDTTFAMPSFDTINPSQLQQSAPPSVQTVENTEQFPSETPSQPSPMQTASLDPFGFSNIDLGWTANPTSMEKANQLSSQTGYRNDWQQFASPLDVAMGIPAPGWNAVSAPTQVAGNVPTPPSRTPDLEQPVTPPSVPVAPAPAPAPVAPSAPPPAPAQVIPASVQTPAPKPEEEQKKSLVQTYGPTVAGAIAGMALPFPVNAVVGLPALFGGPNIIKDFAEHLLSGNAVFQPGTPTMNTNSSASLLPATSSTSTTPTAAPAPAVQETPAPENTPRNDLIATLFDVDKFIGPGAYNGYSPRPIG